MKYSRISLALLILAVSVLSLGFARGSGKAGASPSSTAFNTLQSSAGLTTSSQSEAARKLPGKSQSRTVESVMDMSTAFPVVVRTPSGSTAGLSGLYHIPGDFSSIGAAAAVLNFNGATGDVVFQLDSSSYSESAVTIGSYSGSGTYNVTIKPRPTKAVTVNFLTSSSSGKGFAFTGAKNITIDGVNSGGASLTLKYVTGTFPSSDAFAATIYVTGNSDGITVKKTTIWGNIKGTYAAQTDGRPAVFIYGGTGGENNQNIKIDSCTIINATFGLKILNSALANRANHIWYTNNKVGLAYGGAVLLGCLTEGAYDFHYDYNTIDGIVVNDYYWNNVATEYNAVFTFAAFSGTGGFLFNSGQYSAGHVYNSDPATTVAYNVVKSVTWSGGAEGGFVIYGLVVRIGGAVAVHDNRITGILNTDPAAASNTIGFRISAPLVYHNSVRFTGAHPTNIITTCLNMDAGDARNNAFSNEFTGPSAGNIRGMNLPGGTADYNAIFSNGNPVGSFATWAATIAGDPTHNQHSINAAVNFTADLHIAGGPSSAENMGLGGLLASGDVDGDVRSVTTPDAGADEFANTGTTPIDVLPVTITVPAADGNPISVAQTPKVTVKNNSAVASGAFNITLTKSGTGGESYTDTKVGVTLLPGEVKSVTMNLAWTPTSPFGSRTFTAITSLGGDANTTNDTLAQAKNVPAPTAVASLYNQCFDDSLAHGWAGTGDFVLGTGFAKLGGVYNGPAGATWVTKTTGNYSTGRVLHSVVSPFFDISTFPGDSVWVSFVHSLATEPNWDRSIFQYTTDNVNWTRLGVLNDPNGINWYKQSVYQWAETDLDNFDSAGATIAGFPWTPVGSNPGWTSNGDILGADTHTGPNGYVFVQLKVAGLTIAQKGFIRFRYLAFSDNSGTSGIAAAPGDGWAFDCFRLAKTPSTFTGGTISGKRYLDVNGNGANNTEPNEAAAKVYLSYFGVLTDSATTNGTGDYSFPIGVPGTYQVSINKPGFVTTQPTTGFYTVNHPADGSNVTGKDFGTYQGSISGQKFNDKNGNGTKDAGDVGLAGWTIQLHKDSCNGATVQTAVTDGSGNYSFNVAPATYYVKEVTQPATYRQTRPANNCIPITVSGATGTFVSIGNDFGNYKKGSIKIEKVVDLNGNGIKEGGDVTAMPVGATAKFYLKRGATTIDSVTLGNLILNTTLVLDSGSYSFTEAVLTPGWVRTIPLGTPTQSFIVDTSATILTISYANFKMVTLSGTKYEDMNGNGVRDSGEAGLANWKINVKGGLFFGSTSATTDTNGNWLIDSVGGSKDTVTEVVQPGWTQTAPASGQQIVNVSSGSNPSGLDFGNFKNVTVSGVKYRDRNSDHTKQAGEEGLGGWQINLTGTGAGSTTSDSTGAYSFSNVGPGSHTLSETAQVGWTTTEPIGGTYTFSPTSGVNQTTGRNFGNFKSGDSTTLYRTFTSDEFEDGAQHKKVKPAKAGKPFIEANLQTLMYDYFKQFGLTSEIQVGVPNVLNAGGKVKAYVYPKSYTDVFKSLWDKGVVHSTDVDSTEIHRGLDIDNKGKQLLKRYKSLSPKKQRNDTFEELLVLSVNIALSDAGKTPGGLGSLIYNDGGAGAYNGQTVNQIMAAANNVMTNTDFVGLDVYTRLEEVASKINDAFSCGGVDCETIQPFLHGQAGGYDSASWAGSAKVVVNGLYSVASIPYMKANPNAAPTTTPKVTPVQLPEVYALYQNYPNPFNPTTTIGFDLPNDASVTLKIYNILGQEMGTLFNNEILDAGNQEVDFDASTMPSGVYFYRISAQSLNDDGAATGQIFTQVKKMMLIK